ncbi:MAG: DUF1501 domain-containing protein, partial [Verrucomicrobiales bacterium]|nr:DUF1501 domain-containing protein [Verrucomicrobiales bacterium]
MISPTLSRREMLSQCSTGFGLMALSGLLQGASARPLAHARPRAKNVIFCYMSGGVSHLDSFDPKPMLDRYAGQPMPVKVERTQFNNNGNIFPSPFTFNKFGQSGLEVSSMFPKLGSWCADEMAVIRSMTTPVNEHAQGNYVVHTGFPFIGHPSAGAWVNYGLGTSNRDVPGFVVLQSGNAVVPHGGVGLFSSGFLPAQHQASVIKGDTSEAVANISPKERDMSQRRRLSFISKLDQSFSSRTRNHAQVEAAVRNYETAYRMQAAVPDLCDLKGESEATKKLYGLDDADTQKAAYA